MQVGKPALLFCRFQQPYAASEPAQGATPPFANNPFDTLRRWRTRLAMEFICLPTFERCSTGLFSEQDLSELECVLMLDPEAGDLIPHGRGLRKLRRPLPGRGKSGGARVIYYHINDENLIYLVFAYAKNRQENLTKDQLKQLGKLLT